MAQDWVWVIRSWDEIFETSESRKLKRTSWVPIPNKHDGRGYRRIMSRPDGVEIMGGFVLVAQVASRMAMRGRLVDRDGPLSAEDIALKLGAPVEKIQAAIEVCSDPQIGWICREPLVLQHDPLGHQLERKKEGKAGKGKEGKVADAAVQQPAHTATLPGATMSIPQLAGSVATDLAKVHADFCVGSLKDAREAIEELLQSAESPESVATDLRFSHEAFLPEFHRRRQKRRFVPNLAKWVRDGDWKTPPGGCERSAASSPTCGACYGTGQVWELDGIRVDVGTLEWNDAEAARMKQRPCDVCSRTA